jgi:uroporphyrinogen decarboxylase
MSIDFTPDFNRVRTALLLQGEPDRVPLAEGGIDGEVKAAFLGRPIAGLKDEVEFWYKAGYDFVPLPCGIRLMFSMGFSSDEDRQLGERVSSSIHLQRSQYSVYGDGSKERAWAEEHTGIIASRADFERFQWPEPEDFDYTPFETIGALLPPGMKVIAYQGWIFTPAWIMMGFEGFSYALHEDPGLVEAMFERIGDLQYRIFQRLIQYDCVAGVWMPDDIAYSTGLMVNPQVFRQNLFPWFKRMAADCARRDLPLIYHSDGDLTDMLPDIVDCGFNALHPIEPKAMDIVTLKREYGTRLCLMGNLDLGYTLTRGTPAEVEAEVKERIRTIAPGGGYCLGSSNSVTEYVPMANYNAMREAAFKYGKYPIRI